MYKPLFVQIDIRRSSLTAQRMFVALNLLRTESCEDGQTTQFLSRPPIN